MQLEIFFDYACPYCQKAHQSLKEVKEEFPEVEFIWRPCESHPRPDSYGPNSDLCIQGFFYAKALAKDLWEYHDKIYEITYEKRVDIENPEILAEALDGFLNETEFKEGLRLKRYEQFQKQANDYAFTENKFWVVPALKANECKIEAVENVGLTKEQSVQFIETGCHMICPYC